MSSLSENIEYFMRLNIFSKLDTGNQFLNMIISSFFMMYIPFIFNYIRQSYSTDLFSFLYMFRYNTLTLQGLRTISLGGWQTRTQNIFSLRFRALWFYIQQLNSESITAIKEYPLSENKRDEYDESDNEEYYQMKNDIFVVNQRSSFKVCLLETYD